MVVRLFYQMVELRILDQVGKLVQSLIGLCLLKVSVRWDIKDLAFHLCSWGLCGQHSKAT